MGTNIMLIERRDGKEVPKNLLNNIGSLSHQVRFRAHKDQILLNDVIYLIKKSNLGQYILAVRPAPDGIGSRLSH